MTRNFCIRVKHGGEDYKFYFERRELLNISILTTYNSQVSWVAKDGTVYEEKEDMVEEDYSHVRINYRNKYSEEKIRWEFSSSSDFSFLDYEDISQEEVPQQAIDRAYDKLDKKRAKKSKKLL